MNLDFVVRRAEPADAAGMATVHVDTWREEFWDRKHGFIDDGAVRIGHAVREIRLARPIAAR